MNDASQQIVTKLLGDRKLTQLIVLVIGLFALFSLLKPELFFTGANLQSMAYQIPEVAILSIAVMLSMLTGGIDLSIVSISNFAALTAAFIMANKAQTGVPDVNKWIAISLTAGLIVGFIGGSINSFLIAKVNVTPILATLATLTLFSGIAIGIRDGRSITGLPDEFLRIGNGTLFHVPMPFVILLIVAVAVSIYVNKTGLGLKTFLVGANRTAAQYSVLGDRRVIMFTYMISGLLSSIAGLLIASRSASASPGYGSSYVLLAIVIVVLGGVNPFGGFGTVTGVVLASVALQIVSSGFNAMRFNQFYYLISQGLILVLVMILNFYIERQSISRAKSKSQREESK